MDYKEEINEVLKRMKENINSSSVSDYDKFCDIGSDCDHIARLCDQRLEEIENE